MMEVQDMEGEDVPVDLATEGENIQKTPTDEESSSGLPWVEKYRPRTLEELVAHEEIVNILNNLIDNNKLPHLLFYGPPGTGKTSTIIACARKMFGTRYSAMTLELNASDDRGIDTVRNDIKEFAGTKTLLKSGVKLIILDEADAMTADAQAALRRVIEKYTSNTRFCLICNYVNKITPALQSRCTKFRFPPLQPDQVRGRLKEVIQKERVNADTSGEEAILQLSGGDLRRVLNLLQSTHLAYPIVNEENVYLTAGAALPAVIHNIMHSFLNENYFASVKMMEKVVTEFGYALFDIITEINKLLSRMQLPNEAVAYLLDKMSTIEYRLSHGVNEKLQISALVGAFIIARNMMTNSS